MGTGHLVDVHIGRLRGKLRQAAGGAPIIVTVRGRGYRIVAESPGRSADDVNDVDVAERRGA